MKTPAKIIITYAVLAIAVFTAVFYGYKANSLQKALAESDRLNLQMEQSRILEDELIHIDSLLLEEQYSEALYAYKEQQDGAGAIEGNQVELRIAVASKFLALERGLAAKAIEDKTTDMADSIQLAAAPSEATINRLDSLHFVLEKTKVQLARLRRQLSKKSSGTYLTFKSSKGSDMHYVGNVANNKANGLGLALLSTGSRYEGEWKNNLRHGEGSFFWPDGQYYVGSFKNDKRNGKGTYHWENGEKFVGLWKDDQRNGEGTFYSKDGKVISGFWKDDTLVENYKKGKKKVQEQLAGTGL
ncbi:MAG: hypothetical protein KJN76_08395 [Eudoraea sp.]|nr:hypothetical protein [Eudoraea sp.]